MSRIYLAGPLFCAAEKEFNSRVTAMFEMAGYDVFLPQRDGMLAAELDGKTPQEKTKMIFDRDTTELKNCDILVFVTDGRVPDEGACAELGMAYVWRKRCYGIRTDDRSLEDGIELNPLVAGCFKRVFSAVNIDALIIELNNFMKHNKL